MRIKDYNNFASRFLAPMLVWLALLAPQTPLWAQYLPSKTLSNSIEKFKQYRTSDRAKAYDFAVLVLADLDSLVADLDVAMIYDFMAEYHETSLHHYSEALTYRQKAATIYQALGDRPCMARTEALLARIYLRNGEYHNAFSCSVKALEQAREVGDSTTVREAYLALEQVDYFYHHDQERALELNRRVSEGYEGRAQAHQTVRALNNRFNYSLSPEEVNATVARCEAICGEYGFSDLMINIYLNAALQEFMFEDFEASAQYLNQAKPLISNFKEEGYYSSAMGFFHLNRGDVEQAIFHLKRSVELLGNGDFDSKNVHSYFLLQDIYARQERYREAYEALMAFAETYTRQHNTQNVVGLSRLINDMELQHATERHLREVEHNRLLRRLYILSVVVILVVAVLLYSRYRLERKNRELQRTKAEQELTHKNEIIKIQKLQQYQERMNQEQLVAELNGLVKSGDSREMRAELRRIIRNLQGGVGGNANWEEVEKTLVGGNDLFYENLLREYPNLTKNERKLCLFIRMKMSTKEISGITHQSLGSIHVARARLRQKFGLTGDDKSLIAFLDRFGSVER